MNRDEKYSIVRWAMKEALKAGAHQAGVSLRENRSSLVEVRNEKIDRLEEANRRSLNIRFFVDRKYSAVSTSRITDMEELVRFIREAVAGTRQLSEDQDRRLPEPSLYYRGKGPELKTRDQTFMKTDAGEKIRTATAIGKEVTGRDGRILSVTSSFRDALSGQVMVTSNGFEGDRENTYFYADALVSVQDGLARPQAHWYESSVFRHGLAREGIGSNALKRALDKLGQAKVESGKMTMIVENRQAGRILQPLVQALNGKSLWEKDSFLTGFAGKKFGSDRLNLTDDPFIESGHGSRYFDSEGLATGKRPLFENGILKTYFIDTYHGEKLEMEPTSGEPSNLVLHPGDKNLEEIIVSMERAILVTGFNGGNSNGTTGDFSYGIEGFLVDNGRIRQPVSEMNITGNFRHLWERLSMAGNDLYTGSPWRLPSLVFEGVDFSGI